MKSDHPPSPRAAEGALTEGIATLIVRDVCELTDLPDPDDDNCLRVTPKQLEAIVEQRLEAQATELTALRAQVQSPTGLRAVANATFDIALSHQGEMEKLTASLSAATARERRLREAGLALIETMSIGPLGCAAKYGPDADLREIEESAWLAFNEALMATSTTEPKDEAV